MTTTKSKSTSKEAAGPKPKEKSAGLRSAGAKSNGTKAVKRLRPGELDGLVLAHMRLPGMKLPLTAGAIAKEIDRSSGAVANCLERLAKGKQIRRAKKKPRAYDLKVKATK